MAPDDLARTLARRLVYEEARGLAALRHPQDLSEAAERVMRAILAVAEQAVIPNFADSLC